MRETIKKQWQAQIAIFLFILLTLWWIFNNFIVNPHTISYNHFGDWSDVYGLMALWGGLWGIVIAKKWGGMKSIMGKTIYMFSFGLFFQEFGQLAYSLYYDIAGTPGPYPSIGDLGFFGSIPLYIYGIFLLGQASGVKIGLKSIENKLQAIIIPLLGLSISYFLFLQGYKFDWSNPIKIFLDFGYPFGQAIYISFAILVYLLSRGVLGGIMKNKTLFILFTLCVQFSSDYTFLYQSSKGIWQVGGINDYMYLCAYFVMTLALLQFDTVFEKLKNPKNNN